MYFSFIYQLLKNKSRTYPRLYGISDYLGGKS